MTFAELLAEDRRLAILRILDSQNDAVNGSVIQTALDRLGHRVSRDRVRADFAWLDEQGLVTVEEISKEIQVARLTGRGQDAARGRATVPGVKRPRPGG